MDGLIIQITINVDAYEWQTICQAKKRGLIKSSWSFLCEFEDVSVMTLVRYFAVDYGLFGIMMNCIF